MKKLALVLLLLTSPALSAPITVTLNDQDQQTALAALDALAKTQGANALIPGAILLQKLQEAAKAAQTPEPKKEDPK